MSTQTACPTCHQHTAWETNPWRPFCSEQCRLIDLGEWLSDRYRLPSDADSPPTVDDDTAKLT